MNRIANFILRHLFMLVLGLWVAIIGFVWPKPAMSALKEMIDRAEVINIFKDK